MTSVAAYNLQRVENNHYTLTVSVPGWNEHELKVELRGGRLFVAGHRDNASGESSGEARQENSGWIHQGIYRHDFQLSFSIPEHMKVTGAGLADGLLSIDLIQEIAESEKPRRIPIAIGGPRTLEHQ